MATIAARSRNKRKVPQQNGSNKKRKTFDEKLTENSQNEENQGNETNVGVKMMEIFEEELKCNICTEIFVKPSVLNCSHMFCEFCIVKWMKQQRQCPICREKIESHTRVLAFDVYIEKALELLSPEQKKARQELINQRELKSPPKPRRSQRLKNRTCVSAREVLEESGFQLRALIDEVLSLANHFSYD